MYNLVKFDFSEYPVDLKFDDSINKKLLGKMKNEFKGKIITEFISFKSKMYSFTSIDNKETSKEKGVNKKIRHNEHVECLFNEKVVRHNMKRIQSKLYKIGTYDVFTISLSCFDDKRHVLDDGVNTLAYFHKKIRN